MSLHAHTWNVGKWVCGRQQQPPPKLGPPQGLLRQSMFGKCDEDEMSAYSAFGNSRVIMSTRIHNDDDAGNRNRLKRCHKDFWDLVERWHGRDPTTTSGWKGIWNFLQARNVCKIIGNPYFALCVCVYWFIQTSDQSLTFIVYFCGGVTCVPPWMVGVCNCKLNIDPKESSLGK